MNHQETLVSFSDLISLLKRNKKTLIKSFIYPALFAAVVILLLPPKYRAESTFREKSKSNLDGNKSVGIALLVGGADANENAAVSLMKSRKIAEKAIQKKNLQVEIKKEGGGPLRNTLDNIVENIVDNVKVEWAYLRDIPYPVVTDPHVAISATTSHYEGEIPLHYVIKFTSEDTYTVEEKKGKIPSRKIIGPKIVGQGEVGKLFFHADFSFTLCKNEEGSIQNLSYALTIQPLQIVAARILSTLTCETDIRDKTLIKMAFKDRQRDVARDYLNLTMALYQQILREDQQQIAEEQIAYLNKRQEETTSLLKEKMEEHAEAISTTKATIDFLFQTQQSYTQKLLLLDMEIGRLQKARESQIAFNDRYWAASVDSASISQVLNEIRQLHQQRDSIRIALRSLQEKPTALHVSFLNQIKELDEAKDTLAEAKKLFSAISTNTSFPESSKIIDNPKYTFKEWMQKLVESSGECYEACLANFTAYLTNEIHLLEVEVNIIQERLTHQLDVHEALPIFSGIDLTAANHLFLETSKILQEIEGSLLHYDFLLNQLKEPGFEPSSLSTVLEDSVSRGIIDRASQIAILLQDEENRSQRELDRLRSELNLQKEFLKQHLAQILDLQTLRKKQHEEKIFQIQNTQLELIQQKISVYEQSLLDYIDKRILTLNQEKQAINQQQAFLQEQMAMMPEKWATEKLIDQQLDMNRKMMEEITKIIETKNISANVDISQSAPIDVAIAPTHPMRPHLILFSLLGGCLGLFAASSFLLSKSILKGIPASFQNLKNEGQHISGTIHKPPKVSDSKTIQNALATLCPVRKGSLLLLFGKGADYSKELLSQMALKTTRIDISTTPLHDLRDHIDHNLAKEENGWVIATSHAPLKDCVPLLPFFDSIAITITDEPLDDLHPFFLYSQTKRLTFIFDLGN